MKAGGTNLHKLELCPIRVASDGERSGAELVNVFILVDTISHYAVLTDHITTLITKLDEI